MNKPSNPCKWYVGIDPIIFVHEGGSTLFHFAPGKEVHDSLTCWIPINLIFFANNKEHAAEIIERMLKFRILLNKKQKEEFGRDYSIGESTLQLPQLLLDNKDKWIINEACTYQFYKVGWADNDTIL